MPIKFFDMFAGIGGFRSGLENIGDFQCIGHCEIDKFANRAYEAIYQPKGELYFKDARKIKPEELPDFDLICAGFPCQSFSVAGKRLGFKDDTRGTLFFEVARIAQAKRTPLLLLENVPGLLSHDGGRTFKTIISTLVELGYDIEWCVLNSANFGVPQQRRRLYIIANLGKKHTGEILPLTGSNGKNCKEIISGPQGARVYEVDGAACTQTANAGGWGGKTGLYFIDMNVDPVVTDFARCVTARQNAGISHHKGEHSGVLVTTGSFKGKHIVTVMDKHGKLHTGWIRRLMPIECWRLQGFTDEQFFKAEAIGLKDGRLYKMAGNAVSVPVIAAIGQKMKEIYKEDF